MSYRTKLAKPINYVLRPVRVQLVHRTSSDPVIHYWRPARQTIAAAREAGLPLGAYPDKRFAKPGATPDTVRAMLKLGDLHDKFGTVCEIGAGSGRFAEEVIAALHPDRDEIYETAGTGCPG